MSTGVLFRVSVSIFSLLIWFSLVLCYLSINAMSGKHVTTPEAGTWQTPIVVPSNRPG
jgi:hypothetical protein